jgi:23S rRNA (guanosine2251-2'-O)-methyltransferase
MRRNPKKKGPDCKSRKIYGSRVVHEYLRAKPQEIQTLYLLSSFSGTETELLARKANVPIRYESPAFFSTIAPEGVHQGIVASMSPFPYTDLRAILGRQKDLLLILDGILDPRNLGALFRSAEAVGGGGVILTKDRSAPLSAVTEKAAVGATAHLPICRVENLVRSLEAVKEAGYWIVGLVPDAPRTLYMLEFPEKIAVLLGGEEKGLRALTRKMCDFLVALPMEGQIQSLNVAVAGAVTLYEFLRRKKNRTQGQ